jgi:hypothetical protein
MERSKKVALGLGRDCLGTWCRIRCHRDGGGNNSHAHAHANIKQPIQRSRGRAAFDGGAHGRGHGRGHGAVKGDAAALAAKLGVDQAKVEDALRAFREANHPPGRRADGTKPDNAAKEAALAASLAKSLGIDEAKVKAALEELRTQAQVDRAAALKGRLDQAVKDGTLTQAEADAVAKAVEKGVIGGR